MEIYINSLLQKRKRELSKEQDAKQAVLDQKKKEAFGRVCPSCGKQVPPLTLKCDCGFEFTTNKNDSSIEILSKKLSDVKLTQSEEEEIAKAAPATQNAKRKGFVTNKQIDIISTFPVPGTKEDIIDFLSTSVSLAKKELGFIDQKKNVLIIVLIAGIVIPLFGWVFGSLALESMSFSEEKLKKAWYAKCQQVLLKGRSLRGDPEFTQQLDYYERLLNQNNTP